MRINPSGICSDSVFLRRAFLDSIGRLPEPGEARSFLADADPGKRAKLADRLVERPEFADFWALKWADLLRNEEKTMGEKGAWVLERWLRDQIARDAPLDDPGAADCRRAGLDLEKPARELLPHQPRPDDGRREREPGVPGISHAMRSVPQSPVRHLDPGRLLRPGGLLQQYLPQADQQRSPRPIGPARDQRRRDRLPRRVTRASSSPEPEKPCSRSIPAALSRRHHRRRR